MMQQQRLELLTTTRAALVNLATGLAQAMDSAVFEDKNRPLLVAILGSLQSGKKIFPDLMREALMGSTALCRFHGQEGFDEFWYGAINNRPIEISYIDAMWGLGYENRAFSQVVPEDVRSAFLKHPRQAGGISFVQNDVSMSQNGISDMDIWVEKPGASSLYASRLNKSRLQQDFDKARLRAITETGDAGWLRFVQVTVRDTRLLQSPAFQKSWQSFSRK